VLDNRQFILSGVTAATNIGPQIESANSNAANTVTINTDLLVTGTAAGKALTLTGANAGDNTFAGDISNGSSAGFGIIKAGTGKWILSGNNTYTGNTTVSAGKLFLADGGSQTFVIGASGTSNKITGAGTLSLEGAFNFDLTNAGTTLGDSWTIVDVGTLIETYQSTFSVTGFTDAGSDKWTKVIPATSNAWEFDQTTGLLSVVLSVLQGDTNGDGVVDATDYITVKQHIGQSTSAGAAEGDFDGDGDVDWTDLQTLMSTINNAGQSQPAPEPATLFVMMAAGVPALLKRRRSRR